MNNELYNLIKEKYPHTLEALEEELKDELLLFLKKQADYGTKNVSHNLDLSDLNQRMAAFRGQVYRIHEKAERLFNIAVVDGIDSPENETLEDSLKDLSLICKIGLLVLKNEWE